MERVTITIDPNVRLADNQTFARLDGIHGPLAIGADVYVAEPEGGLVGVAQVARIDVSKGFVFLAVDWSSLHEGAPDDAQSTPRSTRSDGAVTGARFDYFWGGLSNASFRDFGSCVHLPGGKYYSTHPYWATVDSAHPVRSTRSGDAAARLAIIPA